MKHIKHYSIFESQEELEELEHPGFPKTEEEIYKILEDKSSIDIGNYTINEDLSIDVEGFVELSFLDLEYLPLDFNYVKGVFNCGNNKLKSLKGSPKKVDGKYDCSYNNLKTLKYAPKEVSVSFSCHNNNLESLEYSPKNVNRNFTCHNNELTSLKGGPKEVGGLFDCSYNNLETLEYSPKSVGGAFRCYDNKIKSLKGIPTDLSSFKIINPNQPSLTSPIIFLTYPFILRDNLPQLIAEFNDYDIVRGDTVILNRLKAFYSDFDLKIPSLDEARKYYKYN